MALEFINNSGWFPVRKLDSFSHKMKNIISIAPWVSTLFKIKNHCKILVMFDMYIVDCKHVYWLC